MRKMKFIIAGFIIASFSIAVFLLIDYARRAEPAEDDRTVWLKSTLQPESDRISERRISGVFISIGR